jgi:hypothetical protein
VKNAIANLDRETSVDALVTVFEDIMASTSGAFRDRERSALELGNELVRRWCERELGRLANRYGDEVLVDGNTYRRHARGVRRYHTLCGGVDVARDTYRLVGIHNGPTVVPLELDAGIVENATPALAFSVTQGFAERPLRHYEAEMSAAHRVVPSRSTLERIGKRVGERIRAALPIVETIVRASEPVVEAARSISIGLDRTTVPMAEPAESKRCRTRPYVRRPPQPVTVAFRMAYVATLAIHDEHGETLKSTRLASTAGEGPGELLRRLGDEVRHVLAQRPDLLLTVVQDGAPELWNLVDAWLEREGFTAAAKMIDRFHVDERLAQICLAVANQPEVARDLYQGWRTQLNRSDGAIDRICRRLNELSDAYFGQVDDDPMPPYWASRAKTHLSGEAASIAWTNLAYLDRHRKYLRYATARRQGLPIGSGVTEGACKSVITMRFKRSGQRWFEHGLSPCLQLRALHLNERLQPCFDLVIASRKASLAAA